MEVQGIASNRRHLTSCVVLCVNGYIQEALNCCWGGMGSSKD